MRRRGERWAPRSLAGTRRGAERCAFCGDARIKHQRNGVGACTAVHVSPTVYVDGQAHYDLTPCTCRRFEDQQVLPI